MGYKKTSLQVTTGSGTSVHVMKDDGSLVLILMISTISITTVQDMVVHQDMGNCCWCMVVGREKFVMRTAVCILVLDSP